MEYYAGIDVSLERSSVCVVDALGKIVKEAKISSEPAALVAFFEALGFAVKRIGLEAGPLSQWLHAGLKRAGFEAVLLETRHVKAALSAMTVKTDRKDARGLAQLIRMGWFRPVHAKSIRSQEVRALLVARKQLLGRLIDVELSIRGILRGFGLKVGEAPDQREAYRLAIEKFDVPIERQKRLLHCPAQIAFTRDALVRFGDALDTILKFAVALGQAAVTMPG
jgi:transposase